MSKKTKIDKESLGINPLSVNLEIKVRALEFEHQYKTNGEGELLPVVSTVEYTPFFKTYATAEHRKLVMKLSPRAKELLIWIMYEIDHGVDYIVINKKRYMEEAGISLNTYKKALDELVRYIFLMPTVYRGVYWINPEFFFKGDRIKKYRNKLKRV